MSQPTQEECAQLLAGLAAPRPTLSPRYFYDEVGSRLFDRITQTPEYYPTRTELSILADKGDEITRHVAKGCVVVELGSGSGDKVIVLLRQLGRARAYRPIDISRSALEATKLAVQKAFPDLPILPYEGDFRDAAAYAGLPEGAPRCVYYSGSTIGNFERDQAIAFLRALRAGLGSRDTLILGADLHKDTRILDAAYNDAQGVTAAFNRNILAHLNRRFGANFDPEAFDHRAFYDAKKRRIEMHLVPRGKQTVKLAGETLEFSPAQSIHTESSYKFDAESLHALADASGFRVSAIVTDDRGWFAEAVFAVP